MVLGFAQEGLGEDAVVNNHGRVAHLPVATCACQLVTTLERDAVCGIGELAVAGHAADPTRSGERVWLVKYGAEFLTLAGKNLRMLLQEGVGVGGEWGWHI